MASIGTGGEKRVGGAQRKIGRSIGQFTTIPSLMISGASADVTVRRAEMTTTKRPRAAPLRTS